jgi:hypothetical protein
MNSNPECTGLSKKYEQKLATSWPTIAQESIPDPAVANIWSDELARERTERKQIRSLSVQRVHFFQASFHFLCADTPPGRTRCITLNEPCMLLISRNGIHPRTKNCYEGISAWFAG